MTLLGLQGPVHTWGLLQPELSHMCLQLELSHVRFMKLSLHFSAAIARQSGRARRLQHARARQGDHHVHGGLMSDMHFSGMLINDIFSRSVASRAVPAAKLKHTAHAS